jgi:hypothetical protein
MSNRRCPVGRSEVFSFRSPYSINVYRWKETCGVYVKTLPFNSGNRCSSVGIDTSHGPDVPRFKSRQGKYIFSCAKRPDRLQVLPCPYLMGTWAPSWGCRSLGVNLTTHLHPRSRLRMSGIIPLLPSIPSWRGQGKIYLLYTSVFE